MVNEIDLWQAFQKGDTKAYSELYKLYVSPLYSYGTKFTNDITLVEDSIHDLFCTLWTSRERLSQPTSIKNYLFKSLRNGICRKINKTTLLVGEEQELDFQFEFAIDEKLTQKEQLFFIKEQVTQAMHKLTSRQREIIYYRFYQDLGFDEIADIMNMQVRATYKLTARALDTLRVLMPAGSVFSLLLVLCH